VNLKLDENLSRHLRQRLSTLGHDVTTAADQELLAQPDTAIAAAARVDGRMLFTLDLEFGDLRKYPPGTHPGIILFRPRSLGPLAVTQFIEAFVRDTDLQLLTRCVVIVEPTRVRVRRPPLGTDSAEWKDG
jgi:predicted nuclease of predicted toxin-antitoxin system